MAKESSFDIVSTVDMQEVDNACQQASRELSQRYDLKGTGATLELSKKDGALRIAAPSEFVASQVRDILGSKLVKRGVDLAAVRWADPVPASGMSVRQTGVELGMPDPYHFSKQFKHIVGMSPTAYLKHVGTEERRTRTTNSEM